VGAVAECASCAATRAAKVDVLVAAARRLRDWPQSATYAFKVGQAIDATVAAAAAIDALTPCSHGNMTPPFPVTCADCSMEARPVQVPALRESHVAVCRCSVWMWDAHDGRWALVSHDVTLASPGIAVGSLAVPEVA
jgi:hypothetical protein